jgi:hypothetical protein
MENENLNQKTLYQFPRYLVDWNGIPYFLYPSVINNDSESTIQKDNPLEKGVIKGIITLFRKTP